MKLLGTCAVLAAAAATIVAAFAYLGPSISIGSGEEGLAGAASDGGESTSMRSTVAAEIAALTQQGIDPQRAREEIEVQGAVDRAGLVSAIEATLGTDYAGVWFEPSAARLEVGVTSPADRERVEEIAAELDLDGDVSTVSVTSTWDQLVAAQEGWNRRLADLFSQARVSTSLMPQENAVQIKLGSSVSAAEREALEARADAAQVNASIVVANSAHLRVEQQASRCAQFKENKAWCNPSIVGGMSIEDTKESERCTAGPAVIKTDLSEETLETFILTAGHCIEFPGGAGIKWYAYDKGGAEKEIGKAVEFLTPANGDKADVGVIRVDLPPGFWSVAGLTPVVPAIAPWSALEPEPFGVEGQVKPVLNHTSCISGQTSGQHCGTISSLEAKLESLPGLVEVDVKEVTKTGDSGAPWYSASEGSLNLIEGTHVGIVNEGINPVFEPLETSFKELGMELELLTQSNETREPCPMRS